MLLGRQGWAAEQEEDEVGAELGRPSGLLRRFAPYLLNAARAALAAPRTLCQPSR